MDPEFEKTYRDHYPKLFRIAAKMLQDPEDAKDVVQDVFTTYYFAMNNEKVIRDTKNWLVRSTINKGNRLQTENGKDRHDGKSTA